MLFYAEGKPASDLVDIHLAAIENDYIKTLGMTMVSGRSFSKEFAGDSASIILNETAIKQLGYKPNTAIGKKIQYDFAGNHGVFQITGVVKNFNFESLHTEIKPCGFTTGAFANQYGYVIVSVNTNNYPQLIKDVEKSWNKLNAGTFAVQRFL